MVADHCSDWLAALRHAINSNCELCIWPLIESIVDTPLCLCLILPQHPGLLSVSFLLTFLSILLFALYNWQFSSSLLSVVDGQCLFYGLAVPSRRALARAGGCQMSEHGWKHGGKDSHGAALRSRLCSVCCWVEEMNDISCAEVTG